MATVATALGGIDDACSLLPIEEARTILGAEVQVDPVPARTGRQANTCRYDGRRFVLPPPQARRNIPLTMISLQVTSGPRALEFWKAYRDVHSNDPNVENIKGIGDDAVWDGAILMFMSGDVRATVQVSVEDRPDRAKAEAAAVAIAGRL